MIVLKINVKKIEKARLYVGAKGTYLDALLIERPDDYGNAGFISQSVSKEERANGVKGAIIGNWWHVGTNKAPVKETPGGLPDAPKENDDTIPF